MHFKSTYDSIIVFLEDLAFQKMRQDSIFHLYNNISINLTIQHYNIRTILDLIALTYTINNYVRSQSI